MYPKFPTYLASTSSARLKVEFGKKFRCAHSLFIVSAIKGKVSLKEEILKKPDRSKEILEEEDFSQMLCSIQAELSIRSKKENLSFRTFQVRKNNVAGKDLLYTVERSKESKEYVSLAEAYKDYFREE